MKQVLELYRDVLENGRLDPNRTGTDTVRVFGRQMRFDLTKGFPLITTKKMFFKGILIENLWFLGCDGADPTNIQYMNDKKVHIWSDWPYKKYVQNVDPNISKAEFEEGLRNRTIDMKHGDLGPVYGKQWRQWSGKVMVQDCAAIDKPFRPIDKLDYPIPCSEDTCDNIDAFYYQPKIDQIAWALNEVRNNPTSRRIIVSAWNPADLNDMALQPCHYNFHLNVRLFTAEERDEYFLNHTEECNARSTPDAIVEVPLDNNKTGLAVDYDKMGIPRGYLDCHTMIRSNDNLLGTPFNIAGYALLTHMFAQVTNLLPGDLVYTQSDSHIYVNHIEQIKEQLTREPYPLPQLVIDPSIKNIDDFKPEHFELKNYRSHPPIKGEVAV